MAGEDDGVDGVGDDGAGAVKAVAGAGFSDTMEAGFYYIGLAFCFKHKTQPSATFSVGGETYNKRLPLSSLHSILTKHTMPIRPTPITLPHRRSVIAGLSWTCRFRPIRGTIETDPCAVAFLALKHYVLSRRRGCNVLSLVLNFWLVYFLRCSWR